MGILAATMTIAVIANRAINTITPAMTATFKPAATTCLDNQLTMLENQGYEIWLNHPLPVPQSTFSACYPPQFMSSIIASAAGTTQAAFSPLVCPAGYTTVATSWPAASNYIACCPSSYGLAPDDTAPSTRPALNGKCYTDLPFRSTIPMTLYGKSSLSNTNAFSVSASTMQAYAIPYEGYAVKAVSPISVPASTSSSSTSKATSLSSSTSEATSSSSPPAATHTVVAADAFSPNTINAHAGDIVIFEFQSGNHSLTESTFNTPCEPLAGGVDSGFRPHPDNLDPFPLYALKVDTSGPQWFYSKGTGDCSSGMAFGLNPSSADMIAEFQRAAIAAAAASASASIETKSESSGGTSAGVKIGVSVGVVILILLVAAALGAFFIHRRRGAQATPAPQYEIGAGKDNYTAENKSYNQSEMDLLASTKKYELPTPGADYASSRYEMAAPTAELASSRFSDQPQDEPSPHHDTIYRN